MLSYIFCFIFKIIRYRYFIVFEDGSTERVYLKYVPDIIYFPREKLYYTVLNETSEIINKTLIYQWIKIEELNN